MSHRLPHGAQVTDECVKSLIAVNTRLQLFLTLRLASGLRPNLRVASSSPTINLTKSMTTHATSRHSRRRKTELLSRNVRNIQYTIYTAELAIQVYNRQPRLSSTPLCRRHRSILQLCVPVSDLERRNSRVVCVISPNSVAFCAYYVKVVEGTPIHSAREL